MTKLNSIAALSLMALAAMASADESGPTIQASDAAALTAAKDTSATVQGKVSTAEWSKSGKVCTIEFDGAPGFMAAAFDKNKEKLDAAFGGDFTKAMTGATIKVSGKLGTYGGKADKFKDAMQIIIKTTSQITVVSAGPGAAAAPATQPATQAAG